LTNKNVFTANHKIDEFGENTKLYTPQEAIDLIQGKKEIQQYLPNEDPDKPKEKWIPKVGDWVYFIANQINFYKKGDICKVTKSEHNNGCLSNEFTFSPNHDNFRSYFRKAEPHEIPVDYQEPKKYFIPHQESELDIWLKKTKAKNLSLEELTLYIEQNHTTSINIYSILEGPWSNNKAQILYDLWNPKQHHSNTMDLLTRENIHKLTNAIKVPNNKQQSNVSNNRKQRAKISSSTIEISKVSAKIDRFVSTIKSGQRISGSGIRCGNGKATIAK
jgi:hypothetical protein